MKTFCLTALAVGLFALAPAARADRLLHACLSEGNQFIEVAEAGPGDLYVQLRPLRGRGDGKKYPVQRALRESTFHSPGFTLSVWPNGRGEIETHGPNGRHQWLTCGPVTTGLRCGCAGADYDSPACDGRRPFRCK